MDFTKLRFSATVKFWMVSIYENMVIPFFFRVNEDIIQVLVVLSNGILRYCKLLMDIRIILDRTAGILVGVHEDARKRLEVVRLGGLRSGSGSRVGIEWDTGWAWRQSRMGTASECFGTAV